LVKKFDFDPDPESDPKIPVNSDPTHWKVNRVSLGTLTPVTLDEEQARRSCAIQARPVTSPDQTSNFIKNFIVLRAKTFRCKPIFSVPLNF